MKAAAIQADVQNDAQVRAMIAQIGEQFGRLDILVALAGISDEELARFKSPAPFSRPARPVPRPAHDAAKPHLVFPPEAYERIFGLSDEEIETVSKTNPEKLVGLAEP